MTNNRAARFAVSKLREKKSRGTETRRLNVLATFRAGQNLIGFQDIRTAVGPRYPYEFCADYDGNAIQVR
jgi:hypothetical protein